MKPLSDEWIQKAEGDHKVSIDEWGITDPVLDAVCFHAQQCIEKYLKACLTEKDISFPKTHDLQRLADLLAPVWPGVNRHVHELALLSSAAIETRYPGMSADLKGAEDAVAAMKTLRVACRKFLCVE